MPVAVPCRELHPRDPDPARRPADPAPVDRAVADDAPDLSPAAREILHVAAVLGPCAVDWLGPIVESSTATVRRAVCEATAAGYLDPASSTVRFRDEHVREAFAAPVSAASRATLHRQLGRQLAAAGAPATLVAHHIDLGAPEPDSETVRWARRAAAEAVGHDPRMAAELLGRAAAAMAVDDPERGEVLALRADALLSLGRPQDCRASLAEALARPTDPATRARLRALSAEALVVEGRPYRAVDEIRWALTSGGDGDELTTARLRAQAAMTRLWAYQIAPADAEAAAALHLADAAGDPVAASAALAVSSRVAAYRGDLAAAIDAGERAVERAGGLSAATRGAPHLYLGLALANADQWDRARLTLEHGAARCEETGTAWALPRYRGALALLAFSTGSWDDAVAAGETSRRIAEDTGCRVELAQVEAIVGLVAHHRGDRAAATAAAHRAAAATGAPDADGSAVPYLCWLNALRAESGGDLGRGVARLRKACDLAFEFDVPLVVMWLAPDLARLAVADGQDDVAEWIAERVAPVARRAATRTADAVVRFCRGLVDQDAEALIAAATGFERAGRPLFAARALDAAAGAAVTSADAVEVTRRAIEIYDGLGACHDGRVARQRLRTLGARTGSRGGRRRPVTGWDSLTPAERDVARLVAGGFANAEIAARLYVSKRTVETHVSRLYAKLQVTSRVALANATEPAPA